MQEALETAGWKEVISLPEWQVYHLLAKFDTGAKSSALDVADIEEVGEGMVRFRILTSRREDDYGQVITTAYSGKTRVRSSNGYVQNRYRVTARIRAGNMTKDVDFTLVSRRSMICRALLGRLALQDTFLVNSGEKYLLGPRRKPRVKELKTTEPS